MTYQGCDKLEPMMTNDSEDGRAVVSAPSGFKASSFSYLKELLNILQPINFV
jgi:hypothetical protein